MSDQTDIAAGKAEGFDAKRGIFGPTGSLKLVSGGRGETLLATVEGGWYLDPREYQELATGARYLKLHVADPHGSLLPHLKAMTAVKTGTTLYKFVAKDSFLGAIPSYEFRVQAAGDQI